VGGCQQMNDTTGPTPLLTRGGGWSGRSLGGTNPLANAGGAKQVPVERKLCTYVGLLCVILGMNH